MTHDNSETNDLDVPANAKYGNFLTPPMATDFYPTTANQPSL
jgi:hypothetical protein